LAYVLISQTIAKKVSISQAGRFVPVRRMARTTEGVLPIGHAIPPFADGNVLRLGWD
jgi:hypothetical protein